MKNNRKLEMIETSKWRFSIKNWWKSISKNLLFPQSNIEELSKWLVEEEKKNPNKTAEQLLEKLQERYFEVYENNSDFNDGLELNDDLNWAKKEDKKREMKSLLNLYFQIKENTLDTSLAGREFIYWETIKVAFTNINCSVYFTRKFSEFAVEDNFFENIVWNNEIKEYIKNNKDLLSEVIFVKDSNNLELKVNFSNNKDFSEKVIYEFATKIIPEIVSFVEKRKDVFNVEEIDKLSDEPQASRVLVDYDEETIQQIEKWKENKIFQIEINHMKNFPHNPITHFLYIFSVFNYDEFTKYETILFDVSKIFLKNYNAQKHIVDEIEFVNYWDNNRFYGERKFKPMIFEKIKVKYGKVIAQAVKKEFPEVTKCFVSMKHHNSNVNYIIDFSFDNEKIWYGAYSVALGNIAEKTGLFYGVYQWVQGLFLTKPIKNKENFQTTTELAFGLTADELLVEKNF